jgi:hypothetical protein
LPCLSDLPETEQKVVWATQAVPVPDLFLQKVDGFAWQSKPSWYIVASEDRTVRPELERFVAKRGHHRQVAIQSRANALPTTSRAGCYPKDRKRGAEELLATRTHNQFLTD